MRQVARVTELSAERGAWIKEQQVDIENGIVIGYRVNMLVTFVLDEEP